MTLPVDPRSPLRQQRWLDAVNESGYEIPAFAAVEIFGTLQPEDAGGPTVARIRRPTSTDGRRIAANGMNVIPIGGRGKITMDFPAWMLSDDHTSGQLVGVAEDSFTLTTSPPSFVVLGGSYEGATRVAVAQVEILLVDAVAMATFCTDAEQPTVMCQDLVPYGSAPADVFDGDTVEAEIGYGLEGCEGDHVMLAWQPNATYKWKVVQVHHQAQVAVQSVQYEECALKYTTKAIRAVNCCPGTTEESIPMYAHEYYGELELVAEYTESMDPENSTCDIKLKGKKSTICGFEAQSLGATAVIDTINLSPVQVGGPVTDDGTCLQQVSRWVWVVCATAAGDPVDILCTEECAI